MARSKERSFLLLLLSMAAVGFVMWLDHGLSGGSAKPLYLIAILLVQAALMVWLFRSNDEKVTYFAEAGAAAPFAIVLILSQLGPLA
jgi:hypothetical protein